MAISCQEVIPEVSPSHLKYAFHEGQTLWGKFIGRLFYMGEGGGGTNNISQEETSFIKCIFKQSKHQI